MKYAFYCLIVLLYVSCKKDENLDQLQASERVFENFKTSTQNSYRYVTNITTTIGINPTYAETTITVTNGKITARTYAVYPITAHDINSRATQYSYTESTATLGTHPEGSALLTLDDIYTKAKNEWLAVDKSKNTITFKTDNNGMISVCGYSTSLADGPFTGINIISITAL